MALSNVQLLQQAAIPVAVVRRQVRRDELWRVVPECCGIVWKTLRARKVAAGRNLAIYWDSTVQLEAGVELHGPFAGHGDVITSRTPAGPVAMVTYLGPYGRLGVAHAAIRDWCQANGCRAAGPNWEIYGHWQDAWNQDPSQIRTDVFYRVAPA